MSIGKGKMGNRVLINDGRYYSIGCRDHHEALGDVSSGRHFRYLKSFPMTSIRSIVAGASE